MSIEDFDRLSLRRRHKIIRLVGEIREKEKKNADSLRDKIKSNRR